MRWLSLPEVAKYMLEIPPGTAAAWRSAGHFDGIVTKKVGAHVKYHPEAAWYFACHGRPAASLEDAYAWAEIRPLPHIPPRGAQLVKPPE